MFEKIFDALGNKLPLLFAKESFKACIWIFFVLIIRFILMYLRMDAYIQNGFIFSLPYTIQIIDKYTSFFDNAYPILSIRIAQSIQGCLFGVAFFSFIFPFTPLYVFQPLEYDGSSSIYGLIIETVVVCLYACIIIALPEILKINRLSPYLISVPVIPLIYYGVSSEFNPAASFALWYIGTRSNMLDNNINNNNIINNIIMEASNSNETIILKLFRGQNNAIMGFISIIHKEHIIGSIIGAILAGLLCTVYFPEDSTSWKSKKKDN